jgi:uncharacterized protein YejL (UPF0352 family)
MKTKVYEVGYWSHEESPRYLFTNKDEYTQEEFNTIITDIVKEILEKHKEKKDNYYKEITFEWILKDVIEALKKNYGFVELESNVSFFPFGWASIATNEWEWETSNDDINVLRKALKNKK